MAGDITDPDAAAVVDGTSPTAAQVNRMIYHPDTTDNSLATINGELATANLKSDTKIRRHHVLPGAFSNGDQGGANANVDFFGDLLFPNFKPGLTAALQFNKYTDSDLYQVGVDEAPYRTVPGASRTIIHGHSTATYIRISWRVSMFLGPGLENDVQENGDRRYDAAGALDDNPLDSTSAVNATFVQGCLRLMVNGKFHPYVLKRYRGAFSTGVPSNDYTNSPAQNLAGAPDFMHWEASAIIDSSVVTEMGLTADSPLGRGFHTVSIKNFNYTRNVRFKCRYLEWTVHR